MANDFRRLLHIFFHLIIPVSLPILIAACSSTPGIDTSAPLTIDDVLRYVAERNSAVTAVEGYGTISIDSPALSNSGSMSIKILKPDSLQLDINGPFGVTVARCLMTRASFLFYDGFNNTVAEGATTEKNLRTLLRVGLGFEDIMDIVSGGLSLPEPGNGNPQGYRDDDNYVLVWKDESGTQEYTVDLRYSAVRRYIRRDTAGDIQEEILFKDFRKRGKIHLPQVVSLSRPPFEESLSLVFQNQTINDLPIRFSFSAPQSAKRIRL